MARTPLSYDGRTSQSATGIYFGAGILILTMLIFGRTLEGLLLGAVCITISIIAVVYYKRYVESEFDDDFFYFQRAGNSFQIALTNILRVVPAKWDLTTENRGYVIHYRDDGVVLKVFIIADTYASLQKFKNVVKSRSEDADLSVIE